MYFEVNVVSISRPKLLSHFCAPGWSELGPEKSPKNITPDPHHPILHLAPSIIIDPTTAVAAAAACCCWGWPGCSCRAAWPQSGPYCPRPPRWESPGSPACCSPAGCCCCCSCCYCCGCCWAVKAWEGQSRWWACVGCPADGAAVVCCPPSADCPAAWLTPTWWLGQ